MAIRTLAAAVTWALAVTSYTTRMCLQFVRRCYNVAAKYPSARSAWLNAKYRHTGGTPPKGVPVFWNYYPYGHVAISLGGGYVRSTDWPSRGRVGTVSIARLSSAWGKRYTGWSEDINGVRVYRATSTLPRVSLSAVVTAARGAKYHSHVKLVQRALNKRFSSSTALVVDGIFGPKTKARYARYQTALGYTGSGADGIPGKVSLTKLGSYYGFAVIA